MVDQIKFSFLILGFFLIFPYSTFQQRTQILSSRTERLALIQLRSSLGLRTRDWPIKSDPCISWTGVQCLNGRVIGINISGFKRTRLGAKNPQFSVDSLSNFTLLTTFNASKLSLLGPIPNWFGTRLNALQVLDLRSCSLTGPIPSSIGSLSNLLGLYLSNNRLSGSIPPSLGQLPSLSILNLSANSLTGWIPLSFASLGNLTSLDLSSNFLSGTILPTIGTLSKLEKLNLSRNGFTSSIPPQLGDLLSLTDLDLGRNSLSGSIPADIRGLKILRKLVIGVNLLSGSLPSDLFTIMNRLQFIELNNNNFSGDIPNALWSMPELLSLDASSNNFSGQLPNLSFSTNLSTAVIDISSNMLYGGLTTVLTRFNYVNVSGNYFEGDIPDYAITNSTLDGNCLRTSSSQRSGLDCATFYASKGMIFDNFGLPNATQPSDNSDKNKHRKWIFIVGGVVGGVVFIVFLVLVAVCITICTRKRGATTTQRETGVGSVSVSPTPGGLSLDLLSLGEAFTYQHILLATDNFKDVNLLKKGHSGDIFRGILEGGVHVVIKKIVLASVKKDAYKLELDFLGKVSNARLVPLLGHCLENENEKFLVYKYIPNGDLSNSLYRKTDSTDDSLQSLDWITRLKIAIGAAEGLSYLHHECNPPFVHRDVQASSILLDDKFEVRLGSLSEVCAQEVDAHQSRITRLWRLPTLTSEQGSSGSTTATYAYDVYCFGKVLLELVTGKLGISSSNEANMKEWLDSTLPFISIYDKELVTNIVDPSLLIDEDLLEEVWAMAIVARSCLNPRPTRRPLMRYILKALENPLKVVREENSGSRNASSRGSWNGALFGSWRQSSSDVVTVSGPSATKMDSFKQSGASNSQGSGRNGVGDGSLSLRRQSREVFPEPSDEDRENYV